MSSDLATRALRLLDPEAAHDATLLALKAGLGPKTAAASDATLAIELAGLALPNPVGLAAGFDKNGEAATAILAAGFGFVECGTVTPRPQAGNPRPRIFRLTEDSAVINRMGFNNVGFEQFAANLRRGRRGGVLGANIGANKDSDDRIGDYVAGLTRLRGLADYFAVNISSPNTPGLRALQTGDALQELLGRIADARGRLGAEAPVFLKVAPDLSEAEIDRLADAVTAARFDGVIVGNTTTSRPAGLRSRWRGEAGGLSGAPLMALSTRALAQFHAAARGRFALIGTGGVGSGADAYAKIRAGARAVQIYTALVYSGPSLLRSILAELSARLKADGFASLSHAVGAK